MGYPAINELGNKYGELIVVAPAESKKRGACWLCHCGICGGEKVIRGIQLRKRLTKSCGCRKKGLPEGAAAFNDLFHEYQSTAKKHNRIWNIPKELFKILTSKSCFYCGTPPYRKRLCAKKHSNGIYLFNGLDRIDNTKGYTPDNVVPCCIICNRAKHTLSQTDFFTWVQKISKNWRR